MPLWRVTVDYVATPAQQQEAIDASIDRLADEAGEVVDSGSGSGFGRRHLDYAFEHVTEADRLATSIEDRFCGHPGLDLTVNVAEPIGGGG